MSLAELNKPANEEILNLLEAMNKEIYVNQR